MTDDITDIGGRIMVAASIGTWLIDMLTAIPVNDLLQFTVSVLGAVYLIHKIKGQRFDNRIKKQIIEENEKRNESTKRGN